MHFSFLAVYTYRSQRSSFISPVGWAIHVSRSKCCCCTALLTNRDRTPKLGLVWPTLPVKVALRKKFAWIAFSSQLSLSAHEDACSFILNYVLLNCVAKLSKKFYKVSKMFSVSAVVPKRGFSRVFHLSVLLLSAARENRYLTFSCLCYVCL